MMDKSNSTAETKPKKSYNVPILENTPVGTKMYLVITNRILTDAWIGEVTYDGFRHHKYSYEYSDYNVRPTLVTEDRFTIKFLYGPKKSKIEFVCNSPTYWKLGPRGWDTDEHLEYGAYDLKTRISGILQVNGCIDTYFTTDLDKAKAYIKENVSSTLVPNLESKIKHASKTLDMLKSFD